MDWTHVAIATDAVIWTKPSLTMDSEGLQVTALLSFTFSGLYFPTDIPLYHAAPASACIQGEF